MDDKKTMNIVNKESLNIKPPSHIRVKENADWSTVDSFPEMEEYVLFLKSEKSQKVKIILGESNLQVHAEPSDVLSDIWYACFLAENGKFIEDKIREKYRKVITNKVIEDQVRAIKTLQKFIEKVPEIGNKAFGYSLQELKKNDLDIPIHTGPGYLAQLLNQYSEELKKAHKYLTTSESLQPEHLGYFGGLIIPSKLPHALDLKKPTDIKKQSLLFHLVFICRHHTAGEELPPGTGGYTMPNIGNPCYKLVTDIAEVILGKSNDLNEDAVTHSVIRLKEKNVRFLEPSWF